MKSTKIHSKRLILVTAWIGVLVLLSGSLANGQIAGGSALNLNGTNGYVSATLISPPANNWTISAWVYLRSGGTIADPRVAIVSSVGCGATTEFLIRGTTVGSPQYMEVARCGQYEGAISTGAVPLNTWVQVSARMTFNGGIGSNVVTFFTNGVSAGVAYLPSSVNVGLASSLALGLNNNSSRKFDGYLDEVQIWNAVVPPVTTHVLNGAEANLIAYYRFDEGWGTDAGNSSAVNASTATLQGSAGWTNIPAPPFPAGTPIPGNDWVAQGPAYVRDNDGKGGASSGAWGILPDRPVDGSVYAAAPHPTDTNILYAAGPNGGIWKTVNAGDPSPNWIPLTDQQPSLSMSCLEFDPTDATHQTVVAAFGGYSSADQLGRQSGPLLGLLRTTDGGANWQRISPTNLIGVQIAAIVARSNILVAASSHYYPSGPGAGLWRSTNWGASWHYDLFDLPPDVYSLVGVPGNNSRLYMASQHGILRSDDIGATWVPVLNGITNDVSGCGPNTKRILLAVHNNASVEVVYAAVLNAPSYSPYIFFSINAGANWIQIGQAPLFASFTHFSFCADPTNNSLAYVRGNGEFKLFRINRSTSTFDNLEHFGRDDVTPIPGRSVHVDSHCMKFDASGNLIETDDGGIYLLPRLAATSGINGLTPNGLDGWRSLIGNLQLTEFWDISYDPLTKVLFGGTQDNGLVEQRSPGARAWDTLYGGDVFKIIMDARSQPGTSIRYLTGGFITPGSFSKSIYGTNAKIASFVNPPLSVLTGETFVPQSFALEINAIDPRRLIVCDANTLFETTDQGSTLRNALLPHTDRFYVYRLSRMVYGGYLNGIPNPDLIWACGQNFPAQNYSIALRTNVATGVQFLGPPAANEPIGIVANSTNWQQAYYITRNNIFQTLNAGQTWSDITANLSGGPALRTLEFLPLPSGNALGVGTDDGVYITRLAYFPRWWTRLGLSLPRAIANSLHYDPSDQILALGTQGRGAWTYSLADWPQPIGPGWALDVTPVAGSYIGVQNLASVPGYTISAWINLRSGGQTVDPRVAILSSTNCGGNPEFLIRSATTNAADPQYLEFAKCGSFNGVLSTIPVPLNQWVHVAVTVSATVGGISNLVSYYINGAPAGANWYVSQNLTYAGNVALAFNNGSTRKFDGLIDQVSFWQMALTAAQIQTIMAKPLTGDPLVDPSRIMSLNFDEGTGTNALGGNNVSLVGSVNWLPSGALFQTLSDISNRPARNITANSATLEASFTPQALPASLTFEYGFTTNYGSAVQQTITPRKTPTLNGVNNFIATTQPRLDPQPFSLSLWFKTTSQQGGRLIGFGDSQTNASGARDRHLYLGTDGLVRFGVFASTAHVIMGNTPCNDGRWHHVAGTFSQADGMRLYLDGAQVASKASVGAALAYVGYWRIGWDTIADWAGGPPSGYFAGTIAEVQIWDTVLSPGFIAGNYQCQLSGTEAGLASYYHLDEGPVLTVLDSASGGSNNGTVFGQPAWAPTVDLPECFSQSVTNLQPATTYHFRAVATTPVITNYTADGTFTTLVAAPTAVTQPATGVTTNAARLNGTVNPGGAAASYYFQYGATTNYGSVTGVSNLVAGVSTVAVSNGIAGLSPGTLYHFRLVATNSAGTNAGVDLTFTTLAVAPTAVTQPASGVTTNAARLNGTVNPGGAAASYYFQYGATTSYGSTTGVSNLVAGVTSVSVSNAISGLSPGTLYHFRLVATNSVGTNAGADLTLTTLAVAPTAVTQPATGVTINAARLNGTVNPGGAAASYYFQYGATTNYGSVTGLSNIVAGVTSVSVSNTISGLSPGTLYHFRLIATNSVGTNAGVDLTFTTLAPPIISGVTLSGTNLIFSVTNGAPGGDWTLLTTTNLTVPANWSTNRSGTFDGLGQVTLTNGIITTEPRRFFSIRVP